MTDDILAAIDARLADLAVDEALALAAIQSYSYTAKGEWRWGSTDRMTGPLKNGLRDGRHVIVEAGESLQGAVADHIARHDPATVLERVRRERAACEADKALLAFFRADPLPKLSTDLSGWWGEHGAAAYRTLRARYLDGER